jgi:MFS family permease
MYVALAPAFGWRAYWWVFVAASAVLGLFAAGTVPSHVDERPSADNHPDPVGAPPLIEGLHEWSVRKALATSQFYVIVGAYTMYLLINTTAHGFAVEHLTEHGVSKDAAAYMLSVEALIGACVSVIGGLLGERVRSKTLLVVSLVALIGGMSALAWAHGNPGAQVSAWAEFLGHPLMLGYAVGVGIGFGLSFVASTMLLLTYFGRRAYLELYSIMCLLSTAAALGPAVGGWARDTLGSFAGVFLLCALAAFLMLIATALMRPPGLATALRSKAPVPMADPT